MKNLWRSRLRSARALMTAGLMVGLLASCGGGAGTEQNPGGGDGGGTLPRSVLNLDAVSIPDEQLRACVNRLAQEQQWFTAEDVDSVVCGDVEIRSIQGLQRFPNLGELKIAAPRLQVSEIQLLASLPLADFAHQPFYDDGDEASPEKAKPALKKLLVDGKVGVVADQTLMFVVLVADDPANADRALSWGDGRDDPQIVMATLAEGSVRVGSHVTLHWAQVAGPVVMAMQQAFVDPLYAKYEGSNYHGNITAGFGLDYLVWPDQSVAEIAAANDPLLACAKEVATAHGWTRTWQITELDCRGRNIVYMDKLKYFPQLAKADLRDNVMYYAQLPGVMPQLRQLDLRNNPLWYDPTENVDTTRLQVLFDAATLAPEPPRISLRECGLHIDNYDANAQYRLWQVSEYDFLGFNYELIKYQMVKPVEHPWAAGAEPDCESVQGRGKGIWVVDVQKSGKAVGARQFLVTDEQGDVVQFILDDYGYRPTITVPGSLEQHFYTVGADAEHYQLTQYGLTDWSPRWTRTLSDLPVIADGTGVYLVEARGAAGLTSKRFSRMTPDGELETLPPRPVAGLPWNVMPFQDEIWFFNIENDWGTTPHVLVWNPQLRQWHSAPDLPLVVDYSVPFVTEGRLCVDINASDEDDVCWNPASGNWEAAQLVDVRPNLVTAGNRLISLEQSQVGLWELFRSLQWFRISPASIAEGYHPLQGVMYIEPGSFPNHDWLNPLLEEYDSATQSWVYFGPALPVIPLRVNFKAENDTLFVLFNDSIVRYSLAQ